MTGSNAGAGVARLPQWFQANRQNVVVGFAAGTPSASCATTGRGYFGFKMHRRVAAQARACGDAARQGISTFPVMEMHTRQPFLPMAAIMPAAGGVRRLGPVKIDA